MFRCCGYVSYASFSEKVQSLFVCMTSLSLPTLRPLCYSYFSWSNARIMVATGQCVKWFIRWEAPFCQLKPWCTLWVTPGQMLLLASLETSGSQSHRLCLGPGFCPWMGLWTVCSPGHPSIDQCFPSKKEHCFSACLVIKKKKNMDVHGSNWSVMQAPWWASLVNNVCRFLLKFCLCSTSDMRTVSPCFWFSLFSLPCS